MSGLAIITRRRGRHEKGAALAPPQRFWDLLLHDQKVREGRWVDPRFEDMYTSLRREYAAWRQQRMG